MTGTSLLAVERLSVHFAGSHRRRPVVRDLDLTVAAGETVALVGESGCGKTMTALALMGLLPTTAQVTGRILWRGENLVTKTENERRLFRGRKLAMVFQEPATSLNPVLPVGEQIAESLRHHLRLSRPQAWQRSVQLLQEVRLADAATRARQYPHQLSGGQRQRVLLAIALAGDPELLIADEPTTALDVTVQARILDLLRRLRRERGMAMIYITHDLALVPALADRILVLFAGSMMESGPAREVLTAPAHPYTRALIAALPEMWTTDSESDEVSTRAAAPSGVGAGCPYVSRCSSARPECWQNRPQLHALTPHRLASCWPDIAVDLASRTEWP
ncbi:MAG: ABC transporter ATP-binding protein [bacterium]